MTAAEKTFLSHPFDDDKLKEECGVFGVIGVADLARQLIQAAELLG